MGRLVDASQGALFYFSNFFEFLDKKISKIKTVFLVLNILEESFRINFFIISKSNHNLKLSSYF